MGNFNFAPDFPAELRDTLDERSRRISDKDPTWMYQKRAYFRLSGKRRPQYGAQTADTIKQNELSDKSIFSLIGLNDPMIIESITADTGYLDTFYNDPNDIRTFKPYIASANIDSSQGKNLIQTGVSNVTVQIKAYTIEDLDEIELNFFQSGVEARIDYGWIGESESGNVGGFDISIFNFGFTVNTDGSFDINIKGISKEATFLESDTLSKLYNLSTEEKEFVNKTQNVDTVTLPEKLKAEAQNKFKNNNLLISEGYMLSSENANNQNTITYYMTKLYGELDFASSISLSLGKSNIFYYITFEDFINRTQDDKKANSKFFVFHNDNRYTSLGYDNTAPSIPNSIYPAGSADPRKYIFPDWLASYGEPPLPLGTLNIATKFEEVLQGLDKDIRNILISIDTIIRIYDDISKDKDLIKDNEKLAGITTIEFIRRLSAEIFKLSGGQVDIQAIRELNRDNVESSNKNRFVIFNNAKGIEKLSDVSYQFNLLSRGSLVRDLQVSSDFNVKTQMMLNCGRVVNGEMNIAAIQGIYTDIPDIEVDNNVNTISQDGYHIKNNLLISGINDEKVNSLADAMRKYNTKEGKTFRVLPFFLKLRVTLDGIHGIPFLSTIKTDRLPTSYRRAGVYFVVVGVEHSFQNGDWSTTIESAMKIKN
jgi:hypothetical protein